MQIGVIGVNHKSADLALREKLAKACRRRFCPEQSIHADLSYVLLSTCNRSEIYFSSKDLAETHSYLLGILRQEIEEEFEHRIYSYFGADCFFHLARVTSGIDSAIIGETEIQGQVKQAYETACNFRRLSSEIHFLFQKCLKIGKTVRTHASLSQGLLTLEEAICHAGTALLGNLKQCRILFVGLSEINHKIFISFKEKGFQNITFCNRSYEKASLIAEKESIQLLPWERVYEWSDYDVAIFGTKYPDFLITREHVKDNFASRRLVIDLSVPRNVDPKIGRLKKVTVLNVDQLNRLIDRKQKLKAAEIARIETQFIAKGVDKQVMIYKLKELQRDAGRFQKMVEQTA